MLRKRTSRDSVSGLRISSAGLSLLFCGIERLRDLFLLDRGGDRLPLPDEDVWLLYEPDPEDELPLREGDLSRLLARPLGGDLESTMMYVTVGTGISLQKALEEVMTPIVGKETSRSYTFGTHVSA